MGTTNPHTATVDSLVITGAPHITAVGTDIHPQAPTIVASESGLSESERDLKMSVAGSKRSGVVNNSNHHLCIGPLERSDAQPALAPVSRSAHVRSDSADVVICGFRVV